MTAQPEALRLADAQDCVTDDNCGYCTPCSVAAELRRLVAQRIALLEACKALLPILDKAWDFDGDVFGRLHNDAVDAELTARAAIKAVEEGK